MISVMFALEDKYGLIIEQNDLADAKTLADLIAVAQAKSAATS